MLKLTKTGIGLLTRQYRSVLKKCWMINVGVFALGAAGVMVPNEAVAADAMTQDEILALLKTGSYGNHTTWVNSDASGVSGYTFKDATSSPLASTIVNTISTDSKVMGAFRMNVDGSTTVNDNTKYFIYTYTKPSNYTAGERIASLTADVTKKIFTGLSNSAIYNSDGTGVYNITADFVGNTANYGGGAIINWRSTIGNITGDMVGNTTTGDGGAIRNGYSTIGNISGDFVGNTGSLGGAINNESSIIGDITGDFVGNRGSSYGGAISNGSSSIISNIRGDFVGNTGGHGGAIANHNSSTISNIKGNFTGNTARASGGAIATGGSTTIGDITGDFVGNTALASGGAISTGNSTLGYSYIIGNIRGDFVGNTASSDGGAIYNRVSTIGNIRGSFTDNTAGGDGGAIYNGGGNLSLLADDHSITFYNNKGRSAYNDIFDIEGTVNLNAASGNAINFGGTIDGDSYYVNRNILNINQGNNYGGDYNFNNQVLYHTINFGAIGAPERKATITLGKIKQADGTTTTYGAIKNSTVTNNADVRLSMQNDYVGSEQVNNITNLTLNHDLRFAIDAKLGLDTSGDTPVEANTADMLGASVITDNGNHVVIDSVNVVGKYSDSGKTATINIAPANSSVYKLAETGADVINMIEGNNYFTQAEYDTATGNLTLSDKLINQSALDEELNNYYTKYGLGGKKQLSSLAVYENNLSSLAVCGASPRQGILSFGVAASISDIALRKGQIAGRSDAQRTSSDDNIGFAAANDNTTITTIAA